MKKHLSFLTLLLGLSVATVAAPIQPQKAKQLAENFFNVSKSKKALLKMSYQSLNNASTSTRPYYIINRGNNQGFVVISGDTRTRAVLAYADKGYLDEDLIESNPAMSGLFNDFVDQIEWAQQNLEDKPSESYQKLARATRYHDVIPIIEPLLEVEKSNRKIRRKSPISWGERYPFNLYCPYYTKEGKRTKSITGPVATALATVMRWHEWPARPKGSIQYLWENTGDTMRLNYDEQPEYDWKNMPEGIDYKGINRETGQKVTNIQAENIGRLLRDVAYGVKTNFDAPSYSGSRVNLFDAPKTLVENFNYDKGVQLLRRSDFSYSEWIAGIKDELTSYGPIVYSGSSPYYTVYFVIDGLAEDGYVHIDWGENSNANCWTDINLIEYTATGLGVEPYRFDRNHYMLRYLKPNDGIKPQPVVEEKVKLSIARGCTPAQFYRDNQQYFTISLKNTSKTKYHYYLKLSFVKEGSNAETKSITTRHASLIEGGETKEVDFYTDFSNFETGNYKLRISYKVDEKWVAINESAGIINIKDYPVGPHIVTTTTPSNLYTYVGEAVKMELPVKNAGKEDYNGKIELLANGITIATDSIAIKAGQWAKLAFNTNNKNFLSLQPGSYKLSIAYGNGKKIIYHNSENLCSLIIDPRQKPAPAMGNVRLYSAIFYQKDKYVGSRHCTVAKGVDLTVKAYLYSTRGFKGFVKIFITDSYGSKEAKIAALESVKNVQIDKYGSGFIEFKVNHTKLTDKRYYVNILYIEGDKEVCRAWDCVPFYVGSKVKYTGATNNYDSDDEGIVVNVDELPQQPAYIPVGFDERNLEVGTTNGIETVGVEGVCIQPTVANEHVTIVTTEAGTATIYSATGAKMTEIALKEGSNTIAVSQFTPGVYFVKVANQTLKFIKK